MQMRLAFSPDCTMHDRRYARNVTVGRYRLMTYVDTQAGDVEVAGTKELVQTRYTSIVRYELLHRMRLLFPFSSNIVHLLNKTYGSLVDYIESTNRKIEFTCIDS